MVLKTIIKNNNNIKPGQFFILPIFACLHVFYLWQFLPVLNVLAIDQRQQIFLIIQILQFQGFTVRCLCLFQRFEMVCAYFLCGF